MRYYDVRMWGGKSVFKFEGYHNDHKAHPVLFDGPFKHSLVMSACPAWGEPSKCTCASPLHCWDVMTGRPQELPHIGKLPRAAAIHTGAMARPGGDVVVLFGAGMTTGSFQ